jgi:hypothetical protein
MYIVGNPITASSYVKIETDQDCIMTICLYSLDGKQLFNKNLGAIQKGINRIEIGEMFQNLSSGTYLFVVRTANKTFANKVIKP